MKTIFSVMIVCLIASSVWCKNYIEPVMKVVDGYQVVEVKMLRTRQYTYSDINTHIKSLERRINKLELEKQMYDDLLKEFE